MDSTPVRMPHAGRSSLLALAFAMASLTAPPAAAQSALCTDFSGYRTGDMIPSGDRVGHFWVGTVPAGPIMVHDSAPPGGPANAIGAAIRTKLVFSTGDDFFSSVTVSFVSAGRRAIRLSVRRGSTTVRAVTLPRLPAGTLRTVTYSGLYGNEVSVAEASGRSIVNRVCAGR